MPEITPNLGIKKPTGNEVVTRQSFNENWDIIDQNAAKKADLDTHLTDDAPHPVLGERISVLESHHANQNMQSITLSHGIQKIATDQATPFVPKFEGRTLVNLLGRDGKCEDLSKWYTSSESATLSLTTDKAVVGDNAIKLTLIRNDIDYGIAAYDVTNIIDKSKYYFLCGYIANGTTNIVCLTMRNTDGVDVISPSVTSCDMTYVGVKCSPLELSNSTNNEIYITGNSANNQYAYFDAIALYEIDQATYDKIDVEPEYTGAKLADKFPHVDDVKHLQNLGLKKCGKNLLPPFNEWRSEDETKTEITSPYEVKLITTEATGMSKIIPALPNTTYTLSCTITGGGDSRIVVGERIVSGGEVKLYRTLINTDSSLTFTTTSDTVEFYVYVTNNSSTGTFTFTNPQLELGSTSTEFEPYNEDYLYLETPLVEGEILEYIDGDWVRIKKWETEVVLDGSLDWEFKENCGGYKCVQVPNYLTYQPSDLNCIKYNGSILTNGDTTDGSDRVFIQEGSLYITISDTDSGWEEGYFPNSDEVKAYFWGWTMCDQNGTTPYVSGNRYWKLAGHEPVVLWSEKANSSPPHRSAALDEYDWEHQHYKLNYQLPEPVTKLVPYEGGIGLHAGDNQVEVLAGVIAREVIKPQIDGDYYYINRSDYGAGAGKLKYTTNSITTVYKNNFEDLSWRFTKSVDNSYGGGYAYIHKDNFDPTTTYTVTYIASPQEFTTSCLEVTGEHSTNLKTVVNELVENMTDVSSDVSVVQNSVTAHLAEKVQDDDVHGVKNLLDYVTYYVDQENGNDSNDGSESSPFKTFTEAIGRTPVGGGCQIILCSDYALDDNIIIEKKNVIIRGKNSYTLNVPVGTVKDDEEIEVGTGLKYRFYLKGYSSLTFMDITVSVDGNLISFGKGEQWYWRRYRCLILCGEGMRPGLFTITMYAATITPTQNFVIVGGSQGCTYSTHAGAACFGEYSTTYTSTPDGFAKVSGIPQIAAS